jgi:hypothetical protein
MEENADGPRYFIDLEGARGSNRSMATLIAGRKCYLDKQADTPESVLVSDPQEHIDRIVEHCVETPDYLPPDTPLKEAGFKVILAGGNRPMTGEEISEDLTARWAMSAYPRDLSPSVLGRILERSESYWVVAIPEPEPAPVSDPDGPAPEQVSEV